MTNVREFKAKAKPIAYEHAGCPECDCDEFTLWLIDGFVVPTCAECDLLVDLTEFQLYKP